VVNLGLVLAAVASCRLRRQGDFKMRAVQLREEVDDRCAAHGFLEPQRTLQVDALGGGTGLDVEDDLSDVVVTRLGQGIIH